MDSLASADGSNGDYIPPSIRHKYTQLTDTRSDHGIQRHTALLPGVGNRVRRAAADVDVASAGQPARLGRDSAGVASLDLRWRQSASGVGGETRGGNKDDFLIASVCLPVFLSACASTSQMVPAQCPTFQALPPELMQAPPTLYLLPSVKN